MAAKRLAVVTGAARGIGRAVVLELLKQGRDVLGIDINSEQLTELESVAKDAGFEVKTECLDITDTEKLTTVLTSVGKEQGGVGILVNNAGITRDNLMIQMSEEDYDKLMAVNLRAAFFATRAVLRPMIRNKFGRIVSLSSVAGVMGNAGQANYAASKAGLIGMSKSIAFQAALKQIHCLRMANNLPHRTC